MHMHKGHGETNQRLSYVLPVKRLSYVLPVNVWNSFAFSITQNTTIILCIKL